MLFGSFLMSLMLSFSLYSMETSLVNLETKYKDRICSLEHLIEMCEAYMHELQADYGQIISLMNISKLTDLSNVDHDKIQIYTGLGKIPASVYQKTVTSLIAKHKRVEYLRRVSLDKNKKLKARSFLDKFNS